MSWDKRNEKAREANKKIFGSEQRAREVMKKNSEVSDRRPPPGYETPQHLRDKGPRGQFEETFKRQLQEADHPYWSGKDHS